MEPEIMIQQIIEKMLPTVQQILADQNKEIAELKETIADLSFKVNDLIIQGALECDYEDQLASIKEKHGARFEPMMGDIRRLYGDDYFDYDYLIDMSDEDIDGIYNDFQGRLYPKTEEPAEPVSGEIPNDEPEEHEEGGVVPEEPPAAPEVEHPNSDTKQSQEGPSDPDWDKAAQRMSKGGFTGRKR